MTELDELIASLRERVRTKNLQSEKSVQNKIYEDEQIIFTADQIRSFRPPELREMRKIAQSKESIRWTESRIFYEQAKFMAAFEDDKPYSERNELQKIYYPTYQRLNEEQLRGYFTWRAGIQRGSFDDSCATYWFLYIYELLHNIGVDSPETGASMLDKIWERTSSKAVRRWIAEWAADYCAYYGISPSCFTALDVRVMKENALSVISNCADMTDEELYEAMICLAPGSVSVMMNEHPKEHMELSCRIIRKVAERYRKQHHKEYADCLNTVQRSVSKEMFRNAVFFDFLAPRSYSYKLTEYTEYNCRAFNWSWSGLGASRNSPDIGMAMYEADNLLRKYYGNRNLLREKEWTKEKKALAGKAMEEMLAAWKEKERRNVVFDISLLDDIRKNSEKIRDRLIVPGSEEEYREEDNGEKNLPEVSSGAEDEQEMMPQTERGILNVEEKKFLAAVADGSPGRSGLSGMRISILCDSINEKMYEIVGDTVIEFDGDMPVIVKDYMEEVKGVLS